MTATPSKIKLIQQRRGTTAGQGRSWGTAHSLWMCVYIYLSLLQDHRFLFLFKLTALTKSFILSCDLPTVQSYDKPLLSSPRFYYLCQDTHPHVLIKMYGNKTDKQSPVFRTLEDTCNYMLLTVYSQVLENDYHHELQGRRQSGCGEDTQQECGLSKI